MPFFEVSAFRNENVTESMQVLAERVYENHIRHKRSRIERRASRVQQPKGVKLRRSRFECCVSREDDEEQARCC